MFVIRSPAGYCFVDFGDYTVSQKVMGKLNGLPIPGSNPVSTLYFYNKTVWFTQWSRYVNGTSSLVHKCNMSVLQCAMWFLPIWIVALTFQLICFTHCIQRLGFYFFIIPELIFLTFSSPTIILPVSYSVLF